MSEDITSDAKVVNEEYSINIISSFVDFIKSNFVQILLFISVFFIIYFVERITKHNAAIMALRHNKMMKEQMKRFKKEKEKGKGKGKGKEKEIKNIK
jgi:dolichol kinase